MNKNFTQLAKVFKCLHFTASDLTDLTSVYDAMNESVTFDEVHEAGKFIKKVQNTFVIVGRVSGCDDVLLFICAENETLAKEDFCSQVKKIQDCEGADAIYIEFCVPLNGLEYNKAYEIPDTSSVFSFDA